MRELFADNVGYFYRNQEYGAIKYMLSPKKYDRGFLHEGDEINSFHASNYGVFEGIVGLSDGIQMPDITGTVSLSAKVKNGTLYFKADNDMSLVSFAAGNLLKIQNDLIDTPKSGPFSTVHMTFYLNEPVPPLLYQLPPYSK